MPVKAVIIGVAAAAAVGAVVWQNREQLLEIAEQTRDDVREFAGERIAELAELLRRVADKISPDRQEEIPMRGRALGFSPSPSTGSSRRSGSLPRSSPAADPFANPPSGSHRLLTQQRPPLRLTGRDSDFTDGLRLRGTAGSVPAPLAVRSYNDHYRQEMPLPPSVASSIVSSAAVASPPVEADIIPPSPSVETLIAVSAASQQEALSETISFRSASLRSAISDTISDAPEAVVVTPPVNPFENPHPFWSIPEWQENTAEAIDTPSSPSLAGSAADELDNISEIASDSGSEGSWMEVASVTSDDDMISH